MVDYETVLHHRDDFWVIEDRDTSGLPIRVRWRWAPTQPTKRAQGITGWADINGKLGRLHVCANTPCGAKWAPSVYGVLPAPMHGRLAQGDKPAVAGVGSVGSPEHATYAARWRVGMPLPQTPPELPMLPPGIATPPLVLAPPTTCGGNQPAVAGTVVETSPSNPTRLPPLPPPATPPTPPLMAPEPHPLPPPGVDPLAGALLEVAAPPLPSQPAPPPLRPISPPRRAALLVGHAAPPCPPLLGQTKAVEQKEAMVMACPAVEPAEDAEGGQDVHIGELVNERLSIEIHAFIDEMSTPNRYIGIASFLLFALRYKLRVRVWFWMESEDVVEKYAPWATDFITEQAPFEVIGCCTTDDGIRAVEDAREVNHWVACISTGAKSHGDGELPSSDMTLTFQGIYLSVGRIVVYTVADGDCGFDAMCLMLNVPRRLTTRTGLRTDIGRFLLQHAGNRAVIAIMHTLVEVSVHFGMFELRAAGEAIFVADVGVVAVGDVNHGDGGVTPKYLHHGDGVVVRAFTDEETRALRWKCQLDKASAETICNIASGLPGWSIQQAIREYHSRSAPAKPKQRTPFLLTRDTRLQDRDAAATHFLQWCKERYGDPLPAQATLSLAHHRMPRGWFLAYKDEHAQLKRVCGRKGTSQQYKACLKRYTSAVSVHLKAKSAMAENPDPEEEEAAVVAAADSKYTDRFRNHDTLKRPQYFETAYKFKRGSERRRAHGGGRHRSATVIRELLMDWYSKIRHSVDCRIMCRIPKKVFLVKALMLHEEYCQQCLSRGMQPERIDIGPNWVNQLLYEYRISSRKPNRTFKVPRWVLSERLEIFWISIIKIRCMIFLHFGYDPVCRNIDQSPFHGDEAGSKACDTLALKGAPTVPLIENHAATRTRVSLNSVTVSSEEVIHKQLPGFEMMFQAQGHELEGKLQLFVFAKGLPFRVTVVTGPKGSYREEHLLNFLETHLEKWGLAGGGRL